jgi:hypothetical protein
MNLDEKTGNEIEPNDPAHQAASLAQVTLKSPKPGPNGPKQRRPRNAADAMGGAAAKDKPGKSKSRKKALSFDDLAQATASLEAAASRANVVSISEVRTVTETDMPAADTPPVAVDSSGQVSNAAAPAPVPEANPAPIVEVPVPEIAAVFEPSPAADLAPDVEGDSMDAALEQSQALLAQTLDDALAMQMEAESAADIPAPAWEEPEPAKPAPIAQEAPGIEAEAAPADVPVNGNGAYTPAAETNTKPAAEDSAGGARSRFEAIAARAARTQGTRTQPGSAVQAALAAQQQAAERTRQGNDFYSFWAQRKNGRRFPSYGDFDAKQIAELWPNTMLLSCGIIASGNVNFTQVMRLTGTPAASETADEVNFTPMLTEWMLAIGREAASAGKPVQDIETFQSNVGSSSYRIVALPLGNEETQVDHVLCNLARA